MSETNDEKVEGPPSNNDGLEQGDRLRPGEVSPDVMEWIAKDLEGTAQLCSALAMLADSSQVDPGAIEGLGSLVRKAAKDIREELAAAESRA
jgi:DNA-binding IclR family transcriptional regulator